MENLAHGAFELPQRAHGGFLERRALSILNRLTAGVAFEVELPNAHVERIGAGVPAFRLRVRTENGMTALRSFDEYRVGVAYLDGDIDVDGDLTAALGLRQHFTDRHPLMRLWATYGQKLVFGQTHCDRKWISEHYDEDPDFYLTFLDLQARCYSHGYFESDDESLATAIQRKLDTAIDACGMQPGWRVLDIGAGWGAFTQHAGRRGIKVTSLTISDASARYVNALIDREQLPCRVVLEHFLEHRSAERYDAIVNLGVTEHLPDYAATLAQYGRLLKPGGRVFLDASAAATRNPFCSFIQKHIWPGNSTPMQLNEYLAAVAMSPFELLEVRNDRRNYLLTTKAWAENLDRCREEVVQRWGERLYRRFRLYLWGCVHSFATNDMTAYRLLLQLKS